MLEEAKEGKKMLRRLVVVTVWKYPNCVGDMLSHIRMKHYVATIAWVCRNHGSYFRATTMATLFSPPAHFTPRVTSQSLSLHTCTNQNTTLHLVCNSKAKRRFFGLTNKDFRLFFSKCTRSQTPVLFVHTSLTSPSLPFRWDALTNPWQITGQPSWGWMRLFSTCWNIPLPSSVSGSVMGPGTTQISPTFLAWPQAAYANKI